MIKPTMSKEIILYVVTGGLSFKEACDMAVTHGYQVVSHTDNLNKQYKYTKISKDRTILNLELDEHYNVVAGWI